MFGLEFTLGTSFLEQLYNKYIIFIPLERDAGKEGFDLSGKINHLTLKLTYDDS
jgi:hypothetical protein